MTPKSKRTYASIEEVLAGVELVAIVPYEVRGARRTSEDGNELNQDLQASFRSGEDRVEVRLRMNLVTDEASLLADISAEYESIGIFDESNGPLVNDFVLKIAAMNILPYIRESITTTAVRLGVPVPVLGLIKQGQLAFDIQAKKPRERKQRSAK